MNPVTVGAMIFASVFGAALLALVILFFSFGLFGPANTTVLVALLVAAVSVSGAIFLILELDHPFGGLMQISRQPMLNALSLLGN